MRGKVRNKFFTLVAQKEQREGRRITNREIARATGVSEPAVARWIRHDLTKVELDVLEAFCEYFDCEVGDLLYIEREIEEKA